MMPDVEVKTVAAGDGKNYPQKRQTVTVEYNGYLDQECTKMFDSTFNRGAPVSLLVRVCCFRARGRARDRAVLAGPIAPSTGKPTGRPFKFRVHSGQVVKGWDVGISRLSLGEKARLKMPSELAYGEQGLPGLIPPNATLYLEVKLIAIH